MSEASETNTASTQIQEAQSKSIKAFERLKDGKFLVNHGYANNGLETPEVADWDLSDTINLIRRS